MSTKIYDGFIIDRPASAVMAVANNIRAAVYSELHNRYIQKTAQLAQSFIDTCLTKSQEEAIAFLVMVYGENMAANGCALLNSQYYLLKVGKNNDGPRSADAQYNFNTNVVLFPTGNLIYGIPFLGEHTDQLIPCLIKVDGYREYGYWNNSDKPDHISDYEWDMRALTWSELLPTGIPSDSGLIVQVQLRRLCTAEDIMPYINHSPRRRAYSMACREIRQKYVQQIAQEEKDFGYKSAVGVVNRALQKVQSPEGQAEVAALAAQYERVLVPITPEDLLMPMKAIYEYKSIIG